MIRKEEVKKLAELSRIEVEDRELDALARDIESIVAYVSEITEVASEGVEADAGILRNVMREDGEPHESGAYTETLLSAAPHREDKYVRVKKILKTGTYGT